VLGEAIHRPDAGEERVDRRLLEEEAGLPGDHGLQRAATAERQDGPAGGLGLDRRDAEVLLSRQQEEGRVGVEPRKLLVRDAAEETDGGAGPGGEPRELRPVA